MWSVCSSTRPGIRRSPPRSSAAAGGRPSPISAMRPSATATQPRSITASASTTRALARTKSEWLLIASPHAVRGELRDVDHPVGGARAHVIIVYDTRNRRAALLLFVDEIHHDRTIVCVERGGRLVEQQDRQVGQEAARDVDALLLAAREGRRRQPPQSLRHVEPRQELAGARARGLARDARCQQRLG